MNFMVLDGFTRTHLQVLGVLQSRYQTIVVVNDLKLEIIWSDFTWEHLDLSYSCNFLLLDPSSHQHDRNKLLNLCSVQLPLVLCTNICKVLRLYDSYQTVEVEFQDLLQIIISGKKEDTDRTPVIGGTDVSNGEYAHMVSVDYSSQ